MKQRLLGLLIVSGLIFASQALADPITFNGGTGWSTNNSGGNATGLPVFTGNSLELTTSAQEEGTSAWFVTPQKMGSFNASFTYTDSNPGQYGAADGVALAFQNIGTNYLGVGGGGLGYVSYSNYPTPNPVPALVLDAFSGSYTQFEPNGLTNQYGGLSYQTTGAVNLQSGDAIGVVLAYNSGTGQLNETLTDMTTLATFNTSYSGVNLASLVGSNTGFVGFTGGTGGLDSTQVVSDFQFTPVPEPASLPLLFGGLALLAGFAWRRRHNAAVA